jgi:hypothetical protein
MGDDFEMGEEGEATGLAHLGESKKTEGDRRRHLRCAVGRKYRD